MLQVILDKLRSKHFQALLRYSTPRKLLNFLRCELEKAARQTKVSSFPYTTTIDTTNICNLKCPLCPTGAKLYGRKPSHIDIQLLKDFLDEMGDFLYIANLYNWGESLLNPNIAEIVSLFHKRCIYTSISTNLNIPIERRLDEVCDAGLDHIILSIDGATEQTYRQYRRGGNFELVLKNLRHLVSYKQKKSSKNPMIEWQFIVFKHNEHEVNMAKKMALELGCDRFSFVKGMGPADWMPQAAEFRDLLQKEDKFCNQLWHNITIQPDGGVTPCCHLYKKEDDFGSLNMTSSIQEMRNNFLHLEARRFFNTSLLPASKTNHPCLSCPLVLMQSHLQDFIALNKCNSQHKDAMAVMKEAI